MYTCIFIIKKLFMINFSRWNLWKKSWTFINKESHEKKRDVDEERSNHLNERKNILSGFFSQKLFRKCVISCDTGKYF